MNFKNATHQVSTGLIVGLSSIVYAISHGALLFSAGAPNLIAIGMTAALITAFVCAIGSYFFDEKNLRYGNRFQYCIGYGGHGFNLRFLNNFA